LTQEAPSRRHRAVASADPHHRAVAPRQITAWLAPLADDLRDHGVGLRILNLGIDTGGSGARHDMVKNTA
jgi:hypothetical protein